MKKIYRIEVDCANCANKMEAAAGKIAGIEAAAVNFMTQKMTVTFTGDADPTAVMQQVRRACKKVASDCEIFL